jgi:hypothetical protein
MCMMVYCTLLPGPYPCKGFGEPEDSNGSGVADTDEEIQVVEILGRLVTLDG